jgi:NAD(P)-dependent dehydrogenase (short-subunit alcohol dehydrogenase family)
MRVTRASITDLDSVYFAYREALPHLLKTKSTIINVSSASDLIAVRCVFLIQKP